MSNTFADSFAHAHRHALTRSSVRLSSTLFADTPEETAARGAALVDQGYTAVKFGWGPMGESAEVDLALVQQARAGVGPDVSLLVDAACVWPDARTALARAKAFEPYDLFLLEEPLHPDDMEGYACSRQHLFFQADLDLSRPRAYSRPAASPTKRLTR